MILRVEIMMAVAISKFHNVKYCHTQMKQEKNIIIVIVFFNHSHFLTNKKNKSQMALTRLQHDIGSSMYLPSNIRRSMRYNSELLLVSISLQGDYMRQSFRQKTHLKFKGYIS